MFSLKKKVLIMVVVFVILISLTNITFAEKTYNYADTVATVSLLNEYSASTIIASLHQNATAVYAYSSLKCGSTTLDASADSGRDWAKAVTYHESGSATSAYGSWSLYVNNALAWSGSGIDP